MRKGAKGGGVVEETVGGERREEETEGGNCEERVYVMFKYSRVGFGSA